MENVFEISNEKSRFIFFLSEGFPIVQCKFKKFTVYDRLIFEGHL